MKKNEFGIFEIVLPAKDGQPALEHNSKIKVSAILESNRRRTQTLMRRFHNRLLWNYPQEKLLIVFQLGSSTSLRI